MLDFTTIDFETANSYRGSPCSVGLIRYRGGSPVDERHWLIRPPERVDYFLPFNTALHGIDADMVRDAPRWSVVLPAISEFIGDDVVIAHNAGFDIGVIRYACAVDNIPWPEMRFLCTLVLSRRAFRLPSYRLPFVTDACGFEMGHHHDALADARAVGGIVTTLADRLGTTDLGELAAAHRISIGRMSAGVYRGSVCTATGSKGLVFPGVNPDADADGHLFGRVVVFTGALMSMTRQIAWEECGRVGALAEKTPTKRTNILVVGDINPATLRPGSNLTGKARRAFELQDAGQDIEVMTEDDFVRCLDGGAFRKFDLDTLTEPARPASRRDEIEPTRQPPKPLRRQPVPTDQTCSVDGCTSLAAFSLDPPTHCVVDGFGVSGWALAMISGCGRWRAAGVPGFPTSVPRCCARGGRRSGGGDQGRRPERRGVERGELMVPGPPAG